MEGWIKLHRQSMESAVFQNANLWKVWCWCLLKANHKPNKFLWNGGEIEVQAGQFITGRKRGAAECQMNEHTFWRILKRLEKMENCHIKSNNKNSLITIVKWGEYQREVENVHSKMHNNYTTSEQQLHTNKNEKKEKNEENTTLAISLFNEYAERVRGGGRSEAIESIAQLLDEGITEETLRECIDRYITTDMNREPEYRLQANTFFGKHERYKDYLEETPQEQKEKQRTPGLTKTQLYYLKLKGDKVGEFITRRS